MKEKYIEKDSYEREAERDRERYLESKSGLEEKHNQ